MNGKKRSDKDLLHLGLPPMELAETSAKEPSNNSLKKYMNPVFPKLVAIIVLILISVGSYITLLSIIQKLDYRTEIIIVTGIRESPNITIEKHDANILYNLINDTSHPVLKRERRHTRQHNTSNSGEESIEHFSDKEINIARQMLMKHNVSCNQNNKDQICKDIVTKLRKITNHHAQRNVNEKVGEIAPHNMNIFSENESTNEIESEQDTIITSTDQTKRETRGTTSLDMMRTNTPLDSESYSHDNLAHLLPYSQLTDTCLLARLLNKHHSHSEGVYNAQAVEYLPQQYENHPLQYSRYVPGPIPPPYSHERAAEARRRVIHPQDAEIFRRFLTTTPRPTEERPSNSTKRVAECPEGSLSCDNGEGCINEKQWCDGHVECNDVSDESRCGCKSRVDKSRICDGYFDCPFGEDEMGCYGCNDFTFSCGDVDINSKSTCFTKDQRCDNIANCPNHRDEIECTMLAPSLHKKPMFAVSNTEGFLHRNFKGNWYAVCKNPYMWAHDACRRETGLIIRPPFIQVVPIDPMLQVNYLSTGPENLIQESNSCLNSSAVYVTCPDLLCGTRVLTTSQLIRENAAVENHLFGRNKRFLPKSHPYPLIFYGNRMKRLIKDPGMLSDRNLFESKRERLDNMKNKRAESRVVGGKPSQPAAWPWMVAMYRDGMFHCGGVVLNQRWVMSAAHCVQKFWEHYYEIQVGMLRRFSFSPQEQNHLVTHVIVNQHYNQMDMRNDLSLLRVKPVIIFSRWIRPICLPGPETAGADWKWGPAPGTICTAVGWGATVEHGPDPDHMREVEVPIWAHCKHREDKAGKEICAGLVEGGKDACQGDSGGPLLCRNPLNSQQWYMAGIVSHGDGCARKDEPGVYTRVSLFVKWIKFHVFSETLPSIQPKQECPGFKCLSGISKCIPNKRVCDKVVDCLNGEDELNCNSVRSTHIFGDIFLTSPQSKASTVFDDQNQNMKKAETELSSTDKPSTYFTSSSSTEAPVKTEMLANTNVSDSTAENIKIYKASGKNQNTESDDSILKVKQLERKIDMKRESSKNEQNKLISDIDFTHASTLEMPNSRSSEDSNNVSNSEEHVTADPNGSTINEEIEKTNQGDLKTLTVTSSNETSDSISHLSSKGNRDADINEDWRDFDLTVPEGLDSSTTMSFPKTNNEKHRKQEFHKTSSESKHILESTADSNTKMHVETKSNLTSENNKNHHLSTLIVNETVEPESKDILVDLLPTSQPTVSSHTAGQDNNESTENQEIFDTSNFDIESSTLKTAPDIEGKIIENLKDFALSKLQLATIKKKHHNPKEFECRRIYQNIPYRQRCDHRADCEDGTDELGCTCTDYLSTFDQKLVCDGIFDCADGQDEIDCYSCPEDHFLCKRSQRCLSSKYVCDGKPQCPQGEDELDCFALSNGKNLEYDFDGRPKSNFEGYLTKKHISDWHIACEDNLSPDQQEQAAVHICRYLGFSSANRYHVKHINLKEDEILKTTEDDNRIRRDINQVPIHFAYRKVDDDTARHIVIKEPQVLKEQCVPNVTKTCMSLYVYCDHSLFTDFDFTQNLLYSREVETAVHMWPWIAKIYAEGEYKCTGVLIDLSWVLVSHSCLWDSLLSHHLTVVLGSHRTLSATNGMYEQIYKVDAKKDLYHSKVALLHLKESARYSSMVKPMVLRSSNLPEEMSNCVAIGQNDKNSSVSVFVKETNDNCNMDTRCFVLQKTGSICAPGTHLYRQWAGIISCHTEQGWYPAASFVENRGECGVGDRIIASEIGNLKNDMKHYVARSGGNAVEEDENFDCEGQRCGRGQCVKLSKVCDGVTDCHDGKDESEEACKSKNTICKKKPYHKGCECSSGELKCRNGKCIAKELFGDGRDDCGDDTDEPTHMSCSNYLSRVKPSRLCDGVLHCKDRSDEDPMFCKCFAKQSYKCHSGDVELCVAPDMVCDGVPDCPEGDDERTCIGLTAPVGSTYGTGQVLVRSHGVWHSKCYRTQNHTKSELEAICREMGYISGHAKLLNPPEAPYHSFNNIVTHQFSDVLLNNNTIIQIRNTEEPIAKAIKDDTFENCYPVYIECL